MKYISTRGLSPQQSFTEVLLAGLAPDGGLYVPEVYPFFSSGELNIMRCLDYVGVAQAVVATFADDIPQPDLNSIIEATYTPEVFGEGITPLKWLEQGKLALLQLSNGPTLAFKDVPLQLLAGLVEYALKEDGKRLNILGATSGDTGSAAEYAFMGKAGVQVFMLSPYGRMSRFQQRQMYTLNDPTIHNLVVDGTFDDCQALVKAINADAGFKEQYSIGAVNSMNWARITAQTAYWGYASLQATKKSGDMIDVSVPSGNFGNALSAYVAKQMGFPIRHIIVATNENDVLNNFFQKDIYRIRKGDEVKVTSSPSMDIASASNFERFMFDFLDRDSGRLRFLWDQLGRDGASFIARGTNQYREAFCSGMASGEDVRKTIRSVYETYGVIIDPHTAVGMNVAFAYQFCHDDVPLIVAETAQPAKFADEILAAIGVEPPVPKGYEGLADLPEHTTRIVADPALVKQYIIDHVTL